MELDGISNSQENSSVLLGSFSLQVHSCPLLVKSSLAARQMTEFENKKAQRNLTAGLLLQDVQAVWDPLGSQMWLPLWQLRSGGAQMQPGEWKNRHRLNSGSERLHQEASQAISSREGSHLGLSQPTFPLLETLLLLRFVAHTCDPSTQEA